MKSQNQTTVIRVLAVSLLFLFPISSLGKENWIKLNSQNFTVIGNSSEQDLRRLATNLEEFRHVLSLLFPKAQIATPVPTTVVLFKSHDSFKPFKPKYKGKTRENVAGYFLTSGDGNYIALTSEAGGRNPIEVIFHEYEHFVIRTNLPNAPLWLNEGLAEFFSTFTTSDDNMKATLGNPIGRHIATLKQGRFLPIDTLVKVNSKSSHYNESDKAGIFYAESWALVHYLMLGNGRKRQPQLTKFISGLGSGIPIEENFRQSFEADYKTIENELRTYVSKFLFPILVVTFSKQLDSSNELQRVLMPEAEVQFYLGDLLLRGRRFDEAEPYLKKSLELDRALTMSQISLGVLRVGQERLPEARKLLEAAIRSDPRNYLGHRHYADVLSQEERYEEAIKAYEQAIQLKPDVAQLHVDLGYAYLGLGRNGDAAEAFKRAIRLNPLNPFFYRSRSYVYLRLARGGPAASDALTYLRLQGWQDEQSPYMAIAAIFGLRQSKQIPPATRVLEDAAAKLVSSEWPFPVIRYLQHQLTAAELLALASDNDKLTEAHTYIGFDLLLSGVNEEALQHFHWVRDHGNKNFVEYPLALAEIARLTTKRDSTAP